MLIYFVTKYKIEQGTDKSSRKNTRITGSFGSEAITSIRKI